MLKRHCGFDALIEQLTIIPNKGQHEALAQ